MAGPAPFLADIADGHDDARASWLRTADGVRIRVARWSTAEGSARGTVLLFPGRTEYIEKYARAARQLAARGLSVVAVDWRGQGLADRLLEDPLIGHVDRFADYQHDVDALVAFARSERLPAPWVVLGHSMGGCIALRALHRRLPVAAAAFSAPMWGIRLTPRQRLMAWPVSTLARLLGQGGRLAPETSRTPYLLETGFEENTLTSDPEMFAWMQDHLRRHPELALGGPSLGWVNAALVEMLALALRPSPRLPAVTFLGSEEMVVDPARIRRRMSRWPGGRLVEVPGARHEILMERPPVREAFLNAVAALAESAVAAAPAPAPGSGAQA